MSLDYRQQKIPLDGYMGNVVGYSGDDNASGPRHEEQRTTLRAECRETGGCP